MQVKIDRKLSPPVAPSNLGLILFVLALARGATVVLQISLKALKAKETQAWLSACCWMSLKPAQSDGLVPHPTPNPLISLLGDRLSKILCAYNEKYNLLFHMDYRQWYKSCRQSDFKCTERDKGNKEKMGHRGRVNNVTARERRRANMTKQVVITLWRLYCAKQTKWHIDYALYPKLWITNVGRKSVCNFLIWSN